MNRSRSLTVGLVGRHRCVLGPTAAGRPEETERGDRMSGRRAERGSADEFGWLLARFSRAAAQVRHAVVVSTDGRIVAMAQGLSESDARRLAVVTVSLGCLARGAADACEAEWSGRIVAEFSVGYLVITAINANCVIGIVAAPQADLDVLTTDVATLAREIGPSIDSAAMDDMVRDLAGRFPTPMLPNSNIAAAV